MFQKCQYQSVHVDQQTISLEGFSVMRCGPSEAVLHCPPPSHLQCNYVSVIWESFVITIRRFGQMYLMLSNGDNIFQSFELKST